MCRFPSRSNRAGARYRRQRLTLAVAVAIAAVSAAAQPAATAAPSAKPAEAADPGRPYEDRVMAGVEPDAVDSAAQDYNPQGWPRGLALQLTRNLQRFQQAATASSSNRTDTQGIQIDAYVDTPNHGALSLHALALGGRSTAGLTSWGLRQTGLPFDDGWKVDNALGTTNLMLPDLARRNSRLALPALQMLGASTVWRNEGVNSLVLGASVGEPGRFEGFRQSRFVRSGGDVNSVFVQSSRGGWTAAAALARGGDILPEASVVSGNTAGRVSASGAYVGVARGDPQSAIQWQASAIGASVAAAEATGLWADATWRDGGDRHQFSLFRFAPGLTWLDRPLPTDLQGASYRYDYNSLAWDSAVNLESFRSVSGQQQDGWYASASTRRLLGSGLSVGGGGAARDFGVSGGSGFAFLQWRHGLGISRLQADTAAVQGGQRSQSLSFDHSLATENNLALSTSLSLERLQPIGSVPTATRLRQTAVTAAINGRALLPGNLALQGSVRARSLRGDGAEVGTSLAASIGLDWQISRDWSLGGSFYANRGTPTQSIALDSPLALPELVRIRPRDHGVFLSLRYALQAGTATAPLGGPPGSGAGRIEGSLFLDANGNDRRDGSETGAGNVLVILDGKFSVRTDADGRFEFASVAAGAHTLAVLTDDLPLPWTLENDQKIPAPVSTRETTRIDISVKRPR